MIKAVCFDFFNTVSYYHPSREIVYTDVCRKLGINVEPKEISQSLLKADLFWKDKARNSPSGKLGKVAQLLLYVEYISKVINGTGSAKINKLTATRIMSKLIKIQWSFQIFDDTIPTMKSLKEKGLLIGLISNVDKNFDETYKSLGLTDYLDFSVTSLEAGCDKPAPGIFLTALNKARVTPEESIYVGDQYQIDILGARGVGMKAILIDRNNWFEDIIDCPKIQTLSQVEQYI